MPSILATILSGFALGLIWALYRWVSRLTEELATLKSLTKDKLDRFQCAWCAHQATKEWSDKKKGVPPWVSMN